MREKKDPPVSPHGFDETMARLLRVKPEPEPKAKQLAKPKKKRKP